MIARMGDRKTKDSPTILLHIIARGKIARSPEAELVARYEKRITWPVKLTELPDSSPGGSSKIPEPQSPYKTVLLDERGKAMASEKLAQTLGRWRDDGMRETRFVLGAADGHSDADRAEADLLLAFGPATWPHLLARAMLMEQLYRATSILAGHPYHRAG
jgi:23S rRNA (pseudouridine1915-N3)-methyltransferase